MSEALRDDYRMTLEAFQAFTADRPEWERWELIDGEAIMQATPVKRHQRIVENLTFELGSIRRATEAQWEVFVGIGTRVAEDNFNEMIPDIMIVPPGGDDLSNWTFEMWVAFEVLSPGSVRRDMVRKPAFYSRIESLTHYFVVAQNRREVAVFARSEGFKRRFLKPDEPLEIATLGVSIPLSNIFSGVQLD